MSSAVFQVFFNVALGVTVASALKAQNTVTTNLMNNEQYFDRMIKIGAPISRDNGDAFSFMSGKFV